MSEAKWQKEVLKQNKSWDLEAENILPSLKKDYADKLILIKDICKRKKHHRTKNLEEPLIVTLLKINNTNSYLNYFPSDNLKNYKSHSDIFNSFLLQNILPISELFKNIQIEADTLNNSYASINDTILSMHKDCDSIKEEQFKHEELLSEINKVLSIFEKVDNIQEKFGDNPIFPLSLDNCILIFSQIHECVTFLKQKPKYRDAPIYLARSWNQAHKLLEVIKGKIFKILEEAFKSIDEKTNKPLNKLQTNVGFNEEFDDLFIRFYAKFRTHITDKAKTFIRHFEKYANLSNQPKDPTLDLKETSPSFNLKSPTGSLSLINRLDINKEAFTMMEECKNYYGTNREKYLFPIVKNTMDDLLKKHSTDHCNLVRNACSFFCNMYNDESNLYYHIFERTSPDFGKYLERLCDVMYNSLRTRIVKVKHLETLTELCSILRDELSLNGSPNGNEDILLGDGMANHLDSFNRREASTHSKTADADESQFDKDSAFEQHDNSNVRSFNETIDRLLGDVRERLVFITHLYVESDIRKYTPSSGDIAYPDKLKMIKDISESLKNSKASSYPNSSNTSVRSGQVYHQKTQLSTLDISVISTDYVEDEPSIGSDNESITSQSTLVSNRSVAGSSNLTRSRGRRSSIYSGYSSRLSSTTSSRRFSNSPYELYGLWYPTLRRTIICLSKLNRCLDKEVFQSLSQDVLGACLNSLDVASDLIRNKSTLIDSELFLVKHLLILREQISPFQTRFSQKEVILDLPNVRDMAMKMVQHKMALLSFSKNNAFLEFIINTAPGYHEQYLDSKKFVDERLKHICQKFINDASQYLTREIIAFLDVQFKRLGKSHVSNIQDDNNDHTSNHTSLLTTSNNSGILKQHEMSPTSSIPAKSKITNGNMTLDSTCNTANTLLSTQEVADFMSIAYKNFKSNAKFIKTSLSLYLANADTEYILFRPIKVNAQKCFCKLRDIIQKYYTDEEQSIIACPLFEQVSLVLSTDYDL